MNTKFMKKLVSIICTVCVLLALSCTYLFTTVSAEDDIWVYIGSSHTKDYMAADYTDGTDALQAAFDDIANGTVSGDININKNITLTRQIVYSGSSWVSLHNEYTLTFAPTDGVSAAAINMNGGGITLKGKSGSYSENPNYVAYGDNAFFENLNLQGKNYISGDISVKNCTQIQINGWNNWLISGNFIVSGNASDETDKYNNFPVCTWTEPQYYTGFVTIEGNFDYSGVTSNKDNVAKFVQGAELNGKYPVTVGGKIISVKTTDIISTVEGASIRLKDDYNGIRFYSVYDDTQADGKNITSVGTIIAPKDLVTGELTRDIGADNFIDVEYDLSKDLFEGKYVVGSIVEIKDGNISREFVARGYVEIDGVTYYSETTSLDTSDESGRSLKNVAQKAFDDSGYYNKLSSEQQSMINSWKEGKPY